MMVVSFSMAYRSFRGGSGRLDTHLDTPPSINRRHPDSCLALVRDTLVQRGIHLYADQLSETKTAVAIYIRDASSDVANGVRLLLVDRGANRLHDTGQV